jgi:hypothetical protein
MSFFVRLMFVFVLAGFNCHEAKQHAASNSIITAPIILSPAHPLACLPYPLQALNPAPEQLSFSVDHIVNPGLDPVSIAVYLRNGSEKKPVGLFSLYPSNKPANFVTRINTVIDSARKNWLKKDWPAAQLCFELQGLKNIKDQKMSVEVVGVH